MIRIQLHLTELQDRKLRALARQRGTVRADLIRRGIDLLLQEDTRDTDSLLDLVGAAGPAGRSDVAERHDDLLYVQEQPVAEYGRRGPAGKVQRTRPRKR